MKKFFKEFRDFAVKGNMIDLAIGVMTFINVIVITLMSKDVKVETELYLKKG